MKIYTKIRIDIDTLEVVEEDSYEYSGPIVLCWGDPGDADEGGNYGTGGGGDDSDDSFDYGWTDYEADAYGVTGGTTGENDDSDPFGFGFVTPGGQQIGSITDVGEYTQARNTVVDITFSILGIMTGFLSTIRQAFGIGPGIGLDIFTGMDLFRKIGNIFKGDYVTEPLDFSGIGAFNTTGPGSDGSYSDVVQEKIRTAVLNAAATARVRQQQVSGQYITEQNQSQQQQFIQPIEYNKYVMPQKPIDEQTITIKPMAQYSVYNFPPPATEDRFTQPKTSIWYT